MADNRPSDDASVVPVPYRPELPLNQRLTGLHTLLYRIAHELPEDDERGGRIQDIADAIDGICTELEEPTRPDAHDMAPWWDGVERRMYDVLRRWLVHDLAGELADHSQEWWDGIARHMANDIFRAVERSTGTRKDIAIVRCPTCEFVRQVRVTIEHVDGGHLIDHVALRAVRDGR